MNNQPSTTIVGGGFGGVYTAKYLLRKHHNVTLISERNYFTFSPLLHEVATGNLVVHDIVFEYESFFKNKRFEFVNGRVKAIDLHKRLVRVGADAVVYDTLVLAIGATTAQYGIVGVEHAFELKSIADAVALKKKVIGQAQSLQHSVSIIVIGAGPTGIELILELDQLLRQLQRYDKKITYSLRVLNATETLLRPFGEAVQKYANQILQQCGIAIQNNTQVTKITEHSVETSSGEIFEADIIVMAAGVTPNTSCVPPELLDKQKHVAVNSYLQTVQNDTIFALGDIISLHGEPAPKLAQTAVDQAKIVAHNILAQQNGKALRPYTIQLQGLLVSLGKGRAAGLINKTVITGPFAWFVWRTVYLFKTPGIVNKLRVAFSWTLNLFTKRNIAEE